MRSLPRQPRERGVVLFIALIAMVAMAFSWRSALMRSIETTTAVTGNLGFHHDRGDGARHRPSQSRSQRCSSANLIVDATHDDPVQGYFCQSTSERGCSRYPIRAAKISNFPLMRRWASRAMELAVRYVIERMCASSGAAVGRLMHSCVVNNARPSVASGSPSDTPRVPFISPDDPRRRSFGHDAHRPGVSRRHRDRAPASRGDVMAE